MFHYGHHYWSYSSLIFGVGVEGSSIVFKFGEQEFWLVVREWWLYLNSSAFLYQLTNMLALIIFSWWQKVGVKFQYCNEQGNFLPIFRFSQGYNCYMCILCVILINKLYLLIIKLSFCKGIWLMKDKTKEI